MLLLTANLLSHVPESQSELVICYRFPNDSKCAYVLPLRPNTSHSTEVTVGQSGERIVAKCGNVRVHIIMGEHEPCGDDGPTRTMRSRTLCQRRAYTVYICRDSLNGNHVWYVFTFHRKAMTWTKVIVRPTIHFVRWKTSSVRCEIKKSYLVFVNRFSVTFQRCSY